MPPPTDLTRLARPLLHGAGAASNEERGRRPPSVTSRPRPLGRPSGAWQRATEGRRERVREKAKLGGRGCCSSCALCLRLPSGAMESAAAGAEFNILLATDSYKVGG